MRAISFDLIFAVLFIDRPRRCASHKCRPALVACIFQEDRGLASVFNRWSNEGVFFWNRVPQRAAQSFGIGYRDDGDRLSDSVASYPLVDGCWQIDLALLQIHFVQHVAHLEFGDDDIYRPRFVPYCYPTDFLDNKSLSIGHAALGNN